MVAPPHDVPIRKAFPVKFVKIGRVPLIVRAQMKYEIWKRNRQKRQRIEKMKQKLTKRSTK